MKKYLTFVLLMIIPVIVMAQVQQEPNYGYGHLGILCYVSVDLKNDPVTSGFLKYTIPTPSEPVDDIMGPVGCYLSNYLGPRSTVDLYVRRTHLELADFDIVPAQVPFNLYVNKWMDAYGATYNDPVAPYQCHYTVILLLNNQ